MTFQGLLIFLDIPRPGDGGVLDPMRGVYHKPSMTNPPSISMCESKALSLKPRVSSFAGCNLSVRFSTQKAFPFQPFAVQSGDATTYIKGFLHTSLCERNYFIGIIQPVK